jgi:hypothetical protein
VLQPDPYASGAFISVATEGVGVRRGICPVPRFAIDKPVRVDAGRDQHHVLRGPGNQPVSTAEWLQHRNFCMHHSPEDYRRGLGWQRQELAQVSHPGSYRGITSKSAEQLVSH